MAGHAIFPDTGRTAIVGVLNVTPDSFSDGGRFLDPEAALTHALQMLDDGADWIDVGGESTRPGSRPVPPDQQIRRVCPIIEAVRHARPEARVSIDTTLAAVARAALDAGAAMVNDISALRGDPAMAELVAGRGCGVILMHMQGTPATMQTAPHYGDVVAEVRAFLAERVEQAVAAGIERRRIVIDPGLGFGKTVRHNLELLNRLAEFRRLGVPVLVGPSRKRFIGSILGIDDPAERLMGTAAAVAAACLAGADAVRVHDVREIRQVVEICAAIRRPDRWE